MKSNAFLWQRILFALCLTLLGNAANAQNPSIASYDPWHGAVGAVISISGNNLQTTQSVSFNNVAASQIQLISAWQIKVTVPAGATTGKIKITNSFGSYTASSDFVVDAGGNGGAGNPQAPSIASFNPWHGVAGDVVTISGANLQTTQSVQFNNLAATQVQVINSSTVKATLPVGVSTGKIKLTASNGIYTTSSDFVVDGSAPAGGGGDNNGGNGGAVGPIAPPPIDPPANALTGHPRLFFRNSDLPRLRSWAHPSNSVWVALNNLAISAKSDMNSGKLALDNGAGTGNGFIPIESYAQLFAFMSQIHPDVNTRADYANRAYTLIMKVFTEAAKGQADGQPYRGRQFALENRANWYGEAFPLTVDWIYQKFTAQDKALIRKTFYRWIQENLTANTTAQEHPQPLGVVNDPQLVDSVVKTRWSANNYYDNHARGVALMSMVLDAADDVPADATDPVAGTLRRFVGNAIGAWLYTINYHEEHDLKGGISHEGIGYGELSLRGVALTLLAMQTAGVENSAVYGPASAMIQGDFWDHDVLDAYVHMMSPAQTIVENWVGLTNQPYMFSDHSDYKNSDFIRVFGALAAHALNAGNTARYAKIRWIIDNLTPGGVAYRSYKIQSAVNGSSLLLPVMYYLAIDPTVSAGVDPRPNMPVNHSAPGLGIALSRTDWTPNASWLTFKNSWTMVDHQAADGNRFDFYRKGEWLTKGMAGYGSNVSNSEYQNTLTLQNSGATNVTFWAVDLLYGSQYEYNTTAAKPTVTQSFGNDYTYLQGDATSLYNNLQMGASDILHASRSLLFLKPDFVVVYDRATSNSDGRFKRFNLCTPTQAVINGKTATMATATGQTLFINTLLPANAVLSSLPKGANLGYEPANYEPMQFRFVSEDLSKPSNTRFLHVLQGADALAPMAATTLVQSQSGTPFEGAIFNGCAVLFKKNLPDALGTFVYSTPLGTTKHYLTGLTPNGTYAVSTQTVNGKLQVTVTPGGAYVADAGGVLALQ